MKFLSRAPAQRNTANCTAAGRELSLPPVPSSRIFLAAVETKKKSRREQGRRSTTPTGLQTRPGRETSPLPPKSRKTKKKRVPLRRFLVSLGVRKSPSRAKPTQAKQKR